MKATLEAGRAMNVLIAERVMGLRVVTIAEECSSLTPGATWQDGGEYYAIPIDYVLPAGADDGAEPEEYLALYSTDIAAAWLVHLAMCDRLFSTRRRYFAKIHMQARLEDGSLVEWPDVLVVLRDRMPLAICRAALAAVEVDA